MLRLIVLCALTLPGIGGAAEEGGPQFPPRILQIHREGVRPGREAEYRKIDIDAALMCARMNCAKAYVTLSSVTGPSEVWYLVGYESYLTMDRAAVQYAEPALARELAGVAARKADLVRRPRTLIARYREPLSHHTAVSMPLQRYLSITTIRIEAAKVAEFEAGARAARLAHEKGGVRDAHFVYQVVSGARRRRSWC